MQITIRNKRLKFDLTRHPQSVSVLSPKSPLYLKGKKADWAVRASFESKKYAISVFLLFTYNPEHLPKFPLSDVPCFDRSHMQTLLKALNDKYGYKADLGFSYLVGSEYGVDKRHKRLPHYHALFMLHKDIDPREFTEFCRSVWTGQPYGRKSQSWKFGNLGFMFPSPKDCDKADSLRRAKVTYKRDYIAISKSACACYAAKYAVKSYGFYRDEQVKSFSDTALKRSTNKRWLPYLFTSRHFGFNMLKWKNTVSPFNVCCDLVRGRVYDPERLKWFNIPQYILHSRLTCREFTDIVQANIPHTKEPLFDDDGAPVMRKRFRFVYTDEGVDIKLKAFWLSLDGLKRKLMANLSWPEEQAFKYAVVYKLYRPLPVGALDMVHGNLYAKDNIERVYMWSYLADFVPECNMAFTNAGELALDNVLCTSDEWLCYTQVCTLMNKLEFVRTRADYATALKDYHAQRCKNIFRGYETEDINDLNAPVMPQILKDVKSDVYLAKKFGVIK